MLSYTKQLRFQTKHKSYRNIYRAARENQEKCRLRSVMQSTGGQAWLM